MRIQSFIGIITLGIGLVACNHPRVVIEGLVEGGDGAVLTLERFDVNRTSLLDSTKVGKDEKFRFTTRLDQPELLVVKKKNGELINLLPSPGETVTIRTRMEEFGREYTVEGSDESERIRVLVEQMNETRSVLDSLLLAAGQIGDPESPQLELVRSAYARAVVSQKRYTIRHIVENLHSLSSVYALYQKFDPRTPVLGQEADLQYFKVVADSLEATYPDAPLTRSLRADILRREADFRQQNQMNTLLDMSEGTTGMIDLAIPDRNGEEIRLSSLGGKAVLVVFWSSGNEASVQALLNLKSTYEGYREMGFEIYAISLDTDRQQWIRTVDFNEFNWINVSELSYPDSRADKYYNVRVLPSSYLLSRDGDIVGRNLFGRRLETWLDNLL